MCGVGFRAILRVSDETSLLMDELILQPITEAPCNYDKLVHGFHKVNLVAAGA